MAHIYGPDLEHSEFIATTRTHARRYANRATQGIADHKPDSYVHAQAVMANLYYAAALDAAHFGNLPELDDSEADS